MTGSVNVDDEVFWPKIREAVNLVSAEHALEVNLVNGTRSAKIGYYSGEIVIRIAMSDTPKPPQLVVP